ncbi:MAG: hypothetical protein C4297_08110 [Gemmataceae bacterium]
MVPVGAAVLAVILLALASVFGYRQVVVWRRSRSADTDEADRSYLRRQAVRRWVGCALMVVLAGLLVGLFSLGIVERLDRLREVVLEARRAGREVPPLDEADQRFLRLGLAYLGIIVAVVLALFVLVWLDLAAIRSYGLRHRKQIQSDRRAMLERELAAWRRQQDGLRN